MQHLEGVLLPAELNYLRTRLKGGIPPIAVLQVRGCLKQGRGKPEVFNCAHYALPRPEACMPAPRACSSGAPLLPSKTPGSSRRLLAPRALGPTMRTARHPAMQIMSRLLDQAQLADMERQQLEHLLNQFDIIIGVHVCVGGSICVDAMHARAVEQARAGSRAAAASVWARLLASRHLHAASAPPATLPVGAGGNERILKQAVPYAYNR